MEFGKALFTIYAIWGEGRFAGWMRKLVARFVPLFIQLCVAFWLWTLNPWLMTFLIPTVWVGYAFLMKSRRVANWQAGEARRREKSWSKNRSKFED